MLFKRYILILFFLAASTVLADDSSKTLVIVNGTPITDIEVLAFNALQADKQPLRTQQEQIALLNQLINTTILAQQGEKENLQNLPQVKAALKMARLQILAEAMVSFYLEQNPVSEQAIEQAYQQNFGKTAMQEYKVRHILVEDEQEAKKIIALLKQGQDFAELAKAHSLDPSKDAGGELGWLSQNQVVQSFGEAMVQLKKGEYSAQPVHTQFGWHIIQVQDIRQQKPPTLDEVKPQLIAALQQKKVAELITQLRQKVQLDIPGDQEQKASPKEAPPKAQ